MLTPHLLGFICEQETDCKWDEKEKKAHRDNCIVNGFYNPPLDVVWNHNFHTGFRASLSLGPYFETHNFDTERTWI